MKPFSLIKKYLSWAKSVSTSSEELIHWCIFFWWPLIFYSLSFGLARYFLYPEGSGGLIVGFGIMGSTFGLIFMVLSAKKNESSGTGFECDISHFLPNWLPIILADMMLLPFVGTVWFLKELNSHGGLLIDASRRKLNFVSIDDFVSGKFKKNRTQPYLFGKRKCTWNEKTILEIAREIVRDQIGRSLIDEEDSETRINREIVTIEEVKINKENKTAQLCFSTTLCSRVGTDDRVEAGYYFVSLALDESLNAVDVSHLLFDSKRGQKTKQEIHRSFDLYLANTSDDFGLGYDPLGLKDREELFAEPDFSPDTPIVPGTASRIAE